MFCPSCGVKNTGGQQCFVCGKKLPSADSDAPAPKTRPGVVQRTPAQAPTPARLGDRLIAVVLDSVLIAALMLPLGALVSTRWSRIDAMRLTDASLLAIAAVISLLFVFVYYWIQEGAFGATIGKAIVGVRVMRAGGAATAGYRSAAIRNVLRIVEGVPLYFPGFFVAVLSNKRRRLGDFAADTVVFEQPLRRVTQSLVVILWFALIALAAWLAWVIEPNFFRFVWR